MINPNEKESSISKRDPTPTTIIKAESKRRRFNLRGRLSSTPKTPTAPIKRQSVRRAKGN